MNTRALLFSFGLLAMTLSASPGFAQDEKPYTPHQYSRSELINFGTYDQPPLRFEFDTIDVKQRPEEHHVDFVVTLDADFQTVIEFFEDAYANRAPVATLASGVMPLQSNRDVVILGKLHPKPNEPVRYTLGHKKMTQRISVDIADAGGKTTITMKNLVMSRLFGGVVPSRVGFKPQGAEAVGLLYN